MLMLFAASAQTVTKPQITMRLDEYLVKSVGLTTDTVGVGKTVLQIPIYIQKNELTYYDAQLKLDSINGAVKVTATLQGKKFSTDAWSDISSDVYNGLSADTIITFSNTTTKQAYNYYQFKISRTSGTAKINYVFLHVKK